MSFPISPTNGQLAALNGITYVYNSTNLSWTRVQQSITATITLSVTSTASSVSTTTGALVVAGGVGIGGNLYASNIYSNGSKVIPTNIQEVTASGGQTVFTVTGGYTVGTVQVFANGINLGSGDFTASNGTTVTVNNTRNAGDIMRFVSGQSSSSINNINALAIAYSVALGS
jgi:hypothetical protein